MTKPSEIIVTSAAPVKVEEASHNLVKTIKPSTVKVAQKERKSEPVRNPAFRESAPLRELQKRLHEESRRPSFRKTKK